MDKNNRDFGKQNLFLKSDNGAELYFSGQLYSESTHMDEESKCLTRLRLYVTDDGQQVYSIVSGVGAEKTRRHYVVTPMGENCRMTDGVITMTMPVDTLFASVFGLCGIDPSRAEELRPAFEENLRKVGG